MLSQRVGNSKGMRGAAGQAVALPMVIIALTIILVVGMFSFEVGRIAIARDQLQAATEAAALAGAAAMAGSSNVNISAAQQEAKSAAEATFRRNEIFGGMLIFTAIRPDAPTFPGQATLQFQFLDPSNNNAPVPEGDPRGKAFEVKTNYALPSLAGKMIGLTNSTTNLEAKSSGGVGQLDVVLCFDCSASMRFRTITSNVRRSFNTATGKVEYAVTNTRDFSVAGGMRPQLLDGAINPQLRGINDNSLPGNAPPGTAAPNGTTDSVVNFDEQLSFGGFTDGDFSFPNVGALVEASRGNLENETVFQSSGAATGLQGVVTPRAGYQAKYFELARKHTHPWFESETAATNFFTLMNNNTRAHFGLVAFNDEVGQDPNSGFQEFNVSTSYPQGRSQFFPLSAIPLNAAETQTNFEEVKSTVARLVPKGFTNIGGALDKAQSLFTDTTNRPDAKRAIIIFTDGIPTQGLPSPEQACNNAANLCRQKGIAVFTVGLNLEPTQRSEQAQVLNQITGIAGNGGRSFQVTDPSQLNNAFSSIARSLTQIVQ